MKSTFLLVAALLVVGNWVFAEGDPDLDDPKVLEKILKEAVLLESLKPRGPDREQLFYQSGTQTPYTGWAKAFFGNGQVMVLGLFKDGKPDGLQTAWHDNGQKHSETRYKDGRLDGLRTDWYKNGQKWQELHWKAGKKDGLWTFWDEDGKVVKQTRYKDGEEVEEIDTPAPLSAPGQTDETKSMLDALKKSELVS